MDLICTKVQNGNDYAKNETAAVFQQQLPPVKLLTKKLLFKHDEIVHGKNLFRENPGSSQSIL